MVIMDRADFLLSILARKNGERAGVLNSLLLRCDRDGLIPVLLCHIIAALHLNVSHGFQLPRQHLPREQQSHRCLFPSFETLPSGRRCPAAALPRGSAPSVSSVI